MARGNQRDLARAKNLKKDAKAVRRSRFSRASMRAHPKKYGEKMTNPWFSLFSQKSGNQLDGYQQAKASLSNAEIMRQKQAKGPNPDRIMRPASTHCESWKLTILLANSRREETRTGRTGAEGEEGSKDEEINIAKKS